MSLQYTIINKQKLDKKGNRVNVYQAQIVSKGKLSFMQLKKEVANKNGIPEIYLAEMFKCLAAVLEEKLLDGYIIELENLGYIHLSLEGQSFTDKSKVDASSITNAHVHFRVSEILKEKLRKVNFFIRNKQ